MTHPTEGLRSALADRYRIEREIGRGGMATVYLARDLKHDRPVALKVLHPELSATLGPDRFQREIRLAAALQHPHVLTVHDSGEVAATSGPPALWFTMPFVDGESLRDRLRRERQLPVEDAVRIAREAAQALQYAHDHRVVHRDIKPENLLLTRDGNTLVADFGIARALGGEGDARLTETGLAVGTPAYMSPEQAAGDKGVDARTDVYSLAAVLYEMLVGETPHTGPTTQAMMVKRLTEPPPSPRAVRASVPEPVDRAVRKALAPVAADRFSTVAEFSAALQTPAESGTVTARPAPAPALPEPPGSRRAVPVAAVTLVLGILIGLGVLFAWRRTGGPDAAAGTRVLAVLPFENLGDSGDAYFADGITDEVRSKLAQLQGMEVIARGSSNEYRGTGKRVQEIARELGAGYLLTGTVRWTKTADGSRVRVSPELVEVRPEQAPRSRWSRQFESGLTDVFAVQAEIASKVADALGVELADSARQELAVRPTQSLEAYDAYLKGEAAMETGGALKVRDAMDSYRKAVSLDPTFLPAWAQLARSASMYYVNAAGTPETAELAKRAAERAWSLGSQRPEARLARGYVQAYVDRDPAQALATVESGLRLAPNSADLVALAASLDQTLGRYEVALARAERAAALDPRSSLAGRRVGYAYAVLRRYAEADAALDRALTLAPTDLALLHLRGMVALARGDIEAFRRLAADPPAGVNRDELLAYLSQFEELGWALKPGDQDRVLELPVTYFDNDPAAWGMVRAHLYHVRGDRTRSRIYADSARVSFEEQLRSAQDDAQRQVLYGVALAYLGRKEDAIRAGRRAVELLPSSRDAYFGPYLEHQLMRVYLLVGEPEPGLDLLEKLLKAPYTLSRNWIRLDPMFDPVRDHPRFRALAEATS